MVCKNTLGKVGKKNDRNDARETAELLYRGKLKPVYHGEHGVRTLKELARSYPTITRALTRVTKDLCQKGWTAQIPGLRLISGTNKFQDAEFASTAIPVLSTIYFEKVARRAHRENAANLAVFLGCVVAHELGHLLLGDPGHSATGIMQPQWGHPQMRQALTGNLLFTRQQATRIQAQARMLASLRPSADPAFPLKR